MLTLLQWRKRSISLIFALIPFSFHCISRRQLVGVDVESVSWFISISPAHISRSRSSCDADSVICRDCHIYL